MDKAVVKAFRLLELLAESDLPMGVTALAEQTELGKSNVHRLLQTLQTLGYARKTRDNQYAATLRVWELGTCVIARQSLREQAMPFMQQLAQMTRETVHLSQLNHVEVLYIEKIESKEPVRAYTQLGGRSPAYCTATGKAMLAYVSDKLLAECLESAQTFTQKTITNLDRFLSETKQIRQRRFAINRGEWRADVIGLASPILGDKGKPIGAIGLSAPASRMQLDELEVLAPKCVEFAQRISLTMGCTEAHWAMAGSDASMQASTGESPSDLNQSAS